MEPSAPSGAGELTTVRGRSAVSASGRNTLRTTMFEIEEKLNDPVRMDRPDLHPAAASLADLALLDSRRHRGKIGLRWR